MKKILLASIAVAAFCAAPALAADMPVKAPYAPVFNWTGFYLVDPADAGYLIVGPYAGSFTPNSRFPITRGLCGAAASSGQVVVVQDVSTDPRYLAGSSMVKSEIVVPIYVNKKLEAELDIESYFADTFTKSEQEFVEACAGVVANYLLTKV